MSDGINSSTAANNVYGGIGEQHAVPGSNLISTKNIYAPTAVPQQGGRRKGRGRKSSKRGGQGLTEIAVPALLLTANHLYGRKTLRAPKKLGKRRFSRRRGRSFRRRR
jgi:hypothetical protein